MVEPLTTQELKRIACAIDSCGGKLTTAAKMLGIPKSQLMAHIQNHKELQSWKSDAAPLSDAETISRAPVVKVSQEQLDLSKAKQEADAQVRKGFEAIGVTGEALAEAMAFKAFGANHFRDIRHYMGGGIAKLFADEMAFIKETREKIKQVSLEKGDIEEERLLREDLSRHVELTLKTYDRAREAAVAEQIIEAKKQEARDAKKKGKAGFAPLPPVMIKADGPVTISQQTQNKDEPTTERQGTTGDSGQETE